MITIQTKFCDGTRNRDAVTVVGQTTDKKSGLPTPILSANRRLRDVGPGYKHSPGIMPVTVSSRGVQTCVKCGL